MLPGPPDLGRFKRGNTTRTGTEGALLFGMIHLRYIEPSVAASFRVSPTRRTDVPFDAQIGFAEAGRDGLYS